MIEEDLNKRMLEEAQVSSLVISARLACIDAESQSRRSEHATSKFVIKFDSPQETHSAPQLTNKFKFD